jgi:imidazolonepropionase-like amidohydrolase
VSGTTRYIVAAAALGAVLLLTAFGVLGLTQPEPAATPAAPAPAESAAAGPSFVIRAKAVYPVTAAAPGPLTPGTIIVRDGRIEAVGTDLDIPADLPVIDLPDEVICPGFVSAGSALAGRHRGDESVSGAYHALDAFDNYYDYRPTLARGTTTAHLDPGEHRLVSGVGAVVKLAGDPEQRVLVPEADLTITLGTFDPPPLFKPPFYASSDVAIEPAQRQRPDSRLGQFLELEERIAAANAAAADPAAAVEAPFNVHTQAFSEAWTAKLPLRFQVRRAADIAGALRFIAEQGRPAYLVGLTEADRLPEALWAARVPVVVRVEETYEQPGRDIGRHPNALAPALDTAGQLAPGPLAIALAGRSGDRDEDLRMVARLAVRGGMSAEQALAAITRTPAEILGVDERVGSLAPGRDADLLVLTGAPLDISSHVRRVYVGGRMVFEAPQREALVIKAGTVWVGDGTVLQDGAVLIEDGKIQAVGHRVPHPPSARVIDAGPDGFLTPGFIDSLGHLGLEGDRSGAGPDMKLPRVLATAGSDFLRVARAGVTTVLLTPYAFPDNGARLTAIKTYGFSREDLVAREVTGLRFSLRGRDPLTGLGSLRGALDAAKKYDEQWKKYQEELAKWEKARAEGKTAKPKEKEETVVEGGKEDPITGTWEVTLSGDPLPETVTTTMTLKLTGDTIEGRVLEPGGSEEVELTGTLNGKEVTLEITVPDSPVGNPVVRAALDREDHMTGTLTIANYAIQFEATRTDKSDVEFKVTRRRQRSKDGRPLPPRVNESLEPYRPLLAGQIPAVVDVSSAGEIAAAIKLFIEENKLPLVLLGADDAADVMDRLVACKDKLGVIVSPVLVTERERRPYWPVIDLSRHGIPVALRSGGEDRARNLPLMGLYAVAEGLGGDVALRALTIDAAKMYHLDDRLGSLQPGRDADVLIFQGHPFDTGSRLERVVISGREVPHEK